MITLILLVLAFVLFLIAGVPAAEPWPYRSRMVCFGLACITLAEIIGRAPSLNVR